MHYIVFEVEGRLAVDKDLKSLNLFIASSPHQKGVTTLSTITSSFAAGFRWINPIGHIDIGSLVHERLLQGRNIFIMHHDKEVAPSSLVVHTQRI